MQMTNAEIIDGLRRILYRQIALADDVTIKAAIKALEAQDVDTVSRQAVMWMLTNLSYTQCRTQGEAEVIGLAKTMLIAMPSAQEHSTNLAEVGTDCISRQAAIDAIDDIESEVADGDGFQYAKWREYFCELPSAQPDPCDVCVHNDDCGDMWIYCPAERRTDDQP